MKLNNLNWTISNRIAVIVAVTLCLATTFSFAEDFSSPIQAATGSGIRAKSIQKIEGVMEVALDPDLLAHLPEEGIFTLLGFPISNGQTVDLELERFHVELASAHAVVSYTDSHNKIISQPTFNLGDAVQFRGGIIGDEKSKVFLSFSSTANAGILVTSNGKTYVMSDGEVDARGPIVITSMSELPPGIIQWKPLVCQTDTSAAFHSDENTTRALVNQCKIATVYIETDYQLFKKLGNNQTALTNYILQMMGAANIIYYKDLQVDLRLAGWFIYTTDASDGFGAYTDSSSALNAVLSKWQAAPYNTYSRTLVSYLSSQNTGGGVALLSQLCSKTLGFSMCGNLDGAFPYPLSLRSSQNWDIMVFCHELGHNFSAPHTHDLGLDNCYTSSGLGSCLAPDSNYPPIGGTIMSYCHQCPGNMSNINMIFHYGNIPGMSSHIAQSSCLGTCESISLTASQDQLNQVTLDWTSDLSASSYTIFRRLPDTTSPKDLNLPAPIATVNTLSYIDLPVTYNINYEYYIRANKSTNSSGSSTGAISNMVIGKSVTNGPTTINATDGSFTDKIEITWSFVGNATSYDIYRDSGTTKIGSSVANSTTYEDFTATPGKNYTYFVKAYLNTGNYSLASPTDSGYRNLSAPLNVTATKGTSEFGVKVTWNAATGATGYKIYRSGTTTAIGVVANMLTFSDITAIPAINYTYTVKATGVVGVSAESVSDTGYRNVSPPTNIVSVGGLADRIELSWTAAIGAISYQIFRDGAPNPIGTTSSTTYQDISVVGGITYRYSLKSIFALGSSTLSAIVSSWRAPVGPVGVSATDGTFTNKVAITWSPLSDAISYDVFRNNSDTKIGSPIGTLTTYEDLTVVPGVNFTYTIKAKTSSGYLTAASLGNDGYRNILPPANMNASQGTSYNVTMTWAASIGATGYQIFRSGTTTAIGVVGNTLTFNDITAIPSTKYTYTVKATGVVGVSATSIGAIGYRNPSAPLNVTATDGTSDRSVTVTWSASVGATGYQIYRSGTLTAIGIVANTITFSDITAIPATNYTYTVKAIGLFGASGVSIGNTGYRNLGAPFNVAATDGTSDQRVTVAWSASLGATGYKIFRSGTTTAIGVVGNILAFNDITAIPSTKYTYTVQAISVLGFSANSIGDTGYRNLSAPTNIDASNSTFTDKVLITWTGSAYATIYQVFRSGTPNAIATINNKLTYNDTQAVPGVIYIYTVKSKSTLALSASSVGDLGQRRLAFTGDDSGSNDNAKDHGDIGGNLGTNHSSSIDNQLSSSQNSNETIQILTETNSSPIDSEDTADSRTQAQINCDNLYKDLDARLQFNPTLIEKVAWRLDSDEDLNGELDVCQRERGDVDLNGVVNEEDLASLIRAFTNHDMLGDLNLDGELDGADFALYLMALEEQPKNCEINGNEKSLLGSTSSD